MGRFKKADDVRNDRYNENTIAETSRSSNRTPEEIAADEYDVRKAAAKQAVLDLYDEATNFADGEAIKSQEEHDVITDLVAKLKAAGKVVEEMRVEEKEPYDKAVKAIQDEFNPFVQKDKGKVDKAVKALLSVLEKWRIAEAERKRKIADAAREAAEQARRDAEAKIQSTAGNMLAREDAEDDLAAAKDLEREAKRYDKAATTGLGLTTRRDVKLLDNPDVGMRWAFDFDAERIFLLVEEMAQEHVRTNKLDSLDGFTVTKVQVGR